MEMIFYKTLLGLLLVVRRIANRNGFTDSVNDLDYIKENLMKEYNK